MRAVQEQPEPSSRPEAESPRALPDDADALVDLLSCVVRVRARERGIAPSQLARRVDLERVVADGPSASVSALEGWRREVIGDDLLALLDGSLAVRRAGGRVVLERVEER